MTKEMKISTLDTVQDGSDVFEFQRASGEASGMYGGLGARLRCETLIADLSLTFINLPPDEVDQKIIGAQRRVCECLGLDVSALWQWSGESPGFLELTHLYRSVDGPPTPAPMDAREYFPWCLEQLLDGQTIAVPSMEALPPEAARDRETWMHFGIKTTLTIPLSAGGGPLIGALSFHDIMEERVWPESLVDQLQVVAQIFANAIVRKRTEQVLRESEERLRFERLLNELSATFINQPPDQIDSVMDEGLTRLLAVLGNDRSSLVEFSPDTGHAVVTHSCAVAGVEPFPVGVFADEHLPWYVEAIRRGTKLFLKRVPDDFPPEAVKEREVCLAQGVKSTVAIPLSVSGSVLGIISFSFLKRYCEWPPEVVSRLQMVGEIFANALVRKRADEATRAALAENKRLRERLEQENVYLREQITLKHHHGRIIGRSQSLKKVLSDAERVAVTDAPVLLLGETGTGKELLAQTIHELSPRKARPMVVVNCASLPATLIESELFGREAGAYTGAASAQVGRFTVADGSTLFLDEIGEFPVELQAKLLRVLQDGRFERLGSPGTVTVNVRIIAATNRDLQQAVRDRKFRADLYHRLNVFPIRVPPLRERPEDIPELVWAFVEALGRRMGKKITSIPRKTLERLQQYAWPGNVRELSNVVERAMILTRGTTLDLELPAAVPSTVAPRMTLAESERTQILRVLHETNWRIRGTRGAAEILAIKPTTLETRMAKLGIKRPKRNSGIP